MKLYAILIRYNITANLFITVIGTYSRTIICNPNIFLGRNDFKEGLFCETTIRNLQQKISTNVQNGNLMNPTPIHSDSSNESSTKNFFLVRTTVCERVEFFA